MGECGGAIKQRLDCSVSKPRFASPAPRSANPRHGECFQIERQTLQIGGKVLGVRPKVKDYFLCGGAINQNL
jgi:hypothetical protein